MVSNIIVLRKHRRLDSDTEFPVDCQVKLFVNP